MKINDKINDKIKQSKFDDLLVNKLKENKYYTIPELSVVTGKSTATIHRHLNIMVDKGFIKRVGSRKNGYWEVRDLE